MDEIALKVAEYLVAPIVRQFSYVWNYKTNLENLETEVRKLKGRRDTLQHSVEEARRNVEEIEEEVNKWLDRVKMMTDELSEVIEENEGANMKCFRRLCPNPKKRYQRSRKETKKVQAVARLYEEGKFDKISYRTILKETWHSSYKGYEVFESRKSTLKEIQDALIDPNVNMIGVYGLGGIGKTTLAREVAAHAEAKKLFNVVAFAEVAINPNIKEIQQEIADRLGLIFGEAGPTERARRLQERLKKEEKVLLVLDNIWGRLNLEDVGIPLGDDHKGCKLLLTARNLHVLSNDMICQKNFEIGALEEVEALNLFKKKAGDCIEDLATGVAKACKGLPIAVNSVAVALKGKEDSVWKNALQELTTHSSRNFEGVAAETYSSIKISYDQLKGEELKFTFLLCTAMSHPSIEDLFRYAMGLGVFTDIKTMEDARNRVKTLVQQLKESSLLLDGDEKMISIHDVVRDVGRSIALDGNQRLFTVTEDKVQWWDDEDKLKTLTGISLHNVSELPEELECPHLKFLYIETTDGALKIPDNFFIGMSEVRVLHLVGFDLVSLPTSLHLLTNLRMLCMDEGKVQDIDLIGELKKLEILSICGYEKRLPEEICNLTRLRLLGLTSCANGIPPDVIAKLTQLEELYMGSSSIQWEVDGGSNVLSEGLFSEKLERYNISIGKSSYNESWLENKWQETSRSVELNLVNNCTCFEEVCHKMPSVKKFLSALDGGEGFPKLKLLMVLDSSCFRTLVDCSESESCDPFPSLETLLLQKLNNVEKIYNGQLGANSFCHLRNLKVDTCQNLKNIFSFSTIGALPLLEDFEVHNCMNITEIFAIGREEDKIQHKKLRSMALVDLPKLTRFCSINNHEIILEDECNTPTPLFNERVEFPNLETLKLSGINSEQIWHDNLSAIPTCFQSLRKLKIGSSHKLKYLFSSPSHDSFPNLEKLILGGKAIKTILQGQFPEQLVPNLKCLVVCDDEAVVFPLCVLQRFHRLKKLKLHDCGYEEILPFGKVEKHIWNQHSQQDLLLHYNIQVLQVRGCHRLIALAPSSTNFQHLTTIDVWGCQGLRTLVTLSTAKSLAQLTSLVIHECPLITEVVANEGDIEEDEIVFTNLKRLQLCNLSSLTSFCSWNYILKFPSLEELLVWECPQMKIFSPQVLPSLMLRRVMRGFDWFCWEGDINTTIARINKEEEEKKKERRLKEEEERRLEQEENENVEEDREDDDNGDDDDSDSEEQKITRSPHLTQASSSNSAFLSA